MNNIKIILSDTYPIVILSILSYIFFRIISRIFNKNKIDIRKELLLLLFIVYLLILFNVVTYPVNEYGKNNLNLFQELFRYKIGSNLFMQNIVGNILLFIPFGMFFYSYFKVKKWHLIIITILYSFSIELTQILIGRVFDIDDIILNLLGSLIGWCFSKHAR